MLNLAAKFESLGFTNNLSLIYRKYLAMIYSRNIYLTYNLILSKSDKKLYFLPEQKCVGIVVAW